MMFRNLKRVAMLVRWEGISTETFHQTDAKRTRKAGTEAKQAGKSAGAAVKDASKATAKRDRIAKKRLRSPATPHQPGDRD